MKRIKLTKNKIALIDNNDFALVSKWKWYADPTPRTHYAVRFQGGRKDRKKIYLHRFLLKPKRGEDIDHLNGNGLDNRRKNLRACSHKENMNNMWKHRKKTVA